MVLVDAYGCNLCQQILLVNLDQQTIHPVDGPQSLGWRWQGLGWQPLHHPPQDATLSLWCLGGSLVIFRLCWWPWGPTYFLPWRIPRGELVLDMGGPHPDPPRTNGGMGTG